MAELAHADHARDGGADGGSGHSSGSEGSDMGTPMCTKRWEVELPEACTSLSVSPKGRLVAAATADAEEIVVLDAGTGERKFALAGHRGGTNCVAFLSGVTLASCGEDGAARVWNVARSECVAELEVSGVDADRSRSGASVPHLAVGPAARCFAVASGRSVVLFTVEGEGASAREPRRRDLEALPSTAEALRFDTKGNLLAAYHGGVTAWSLTARAGEDNQALDFPYEGACLAADMSPCQKWVVAGCHDSSVHIWQLLPPAAAAEENAEGVRFCEMSCGGYQSKVIATEFHAGGRWMASAGGATPTIWDFSDSPSGSCPTLAVGHRAGVTCQAWCPYGGVAGPALLLSGDEDGVALLHDVDDLEEDEPAPKGEVRPNFCLPLGAALGPRGDEITAVTWGQGGWFYTGHVQGWVRGWQLPMLGPSEARAQHHPASCSDPRCGH